MTLCDKNKSAFHQHRRMSLTTENRFSHLNDALQNATKRYKRSSFTKIDADHLNGDDSKHREGDVEIKKNSVKNPHYNGVASTNYLTYHSENCARGGSRCCLSGYSAGANIRIIPAHMMNKHR